MGEITTFSKNDPRPRGMPTQVVFARFEPVVARFCPSKVPKCLINGPMWWAKVDEKWLKNALSGIDPQPFGMHKQVK